MKMVKIYPADSGLPMTVCAGPPGKARRDVRVKVNMTHGTRRMIGNTASVGVRPVPRLVEGWLKPRDQQLVY
jgi:hypothetical protein